MSTSELDGRGTRLNPANRFERLHLEAATDDEAPADAAPVATELYRDASRSVLAENDSPDVGFRYSVNPYRGCTHACAYCYARPGHEYLSLGAGTDFERRIVYKPDAAALLREAFDAPRWRGELVAFSGVTDCYQPLERALGLTRGCLEVCAEYQNPVAVITKSPLVERDVDVLADLARRARVRVSVSVPFWTEDHARALEPFVTTPARRLRPQTALAQDQPGCRASGAWNRRRSVVRRMPSLTQRASLFFYDSFSRDHSRNS